MKYAQAVSVAVVCLALVGAAAAQRLRSATTPGPDPSVALFWSADTTSSVRYNVYRKEIGDTEFPADALNRAPIAPITDCAAFKRLIPEGSPLWTMLANAFADTSGNAPPRPLTNVCELSALSPGDDSYDMIRLYAAVKPAVARVMGLAYTDTAVADGQAYIYRLNRVDSDDRQLPGARFDTVTAGVPDSIPAPVSVRAVEGDARIQLLWSIPDTAFRLFTVYRGSRAGGPWQKVNAVDVSTRIQRDIDSNAVTPPAHGYTDYQRYDSVGNPRARSVPGVSGTIDGPVNGVAYWYRVAHKDPLGNEGPRSNAVSATPRDETPPQVPKSVKVVAQESENGFRISWSPVTRDVRGHPERTASYRVYRLPQGENPADGATRIAAGISHPTDTGVRVETADTSPGLRSDCTDSTHWWRIEAVDSAGNVSRRSVAGSDALDDTTSPTNVTGTKAEGFEDYIRITWDLNTDCNIDRYLIYRARCDYGQWAPCGTPEDSDVRRGRRRGEPRQRNTPSLAAFVPREGRIPDCGGPFSLVGEIPHPEAESRGDPTYFEDRTVPDESPVCYAYLVKAQDVAQNISGALPIPDRPPEIVVCQRLRDRTPPEPAVIADLKARDSSILVDYIGPPVQDIAAYHVYRSDSLQEGPYQWAGGMRVAPPPASGTRLDSPYVAPETVGCDSIPLVSRRYMSAGTFVDTAVQRHRPYWYRVVGIDRNGNEGPVDSAIAVSTFTFAVGRPAPPEISSIKTIQTPCALELSWTPPFDSTRHEGFVVFRGRSDTGPFMQLGSLHRASAFTDSTVAREVAYWYRVGARLRDGPLTRLSKPEKGEHP